MMGQNIGIFPKYAIKFTSNVTKITRFSCLLPMTMYGGLAVQTETTIALGRTAVLTFSSMIEVS